MAAKHCAVFFSSPRKICCGGSRQKIRRRAASQRRERRKEQGEKGKVNAASALFQICQKRGQLIVKAVVKNQQGKGFHQLPFGRQSGRRAAAQTGRLRNTGITPCLTKSTPE